MPKSKIEQETIINYNESEETADIYTYNASLKRKLAELAKERPAEVQALEVSRYGAKYVVPKKWITVKAPRTLTEAQKRASVENAKKARRARGLE